MINRAGMRIKTKTTMEFKKIQLYRKLIQQGVSGACGRTDATRLVLCGSGEGAWS